jgi:hypothetical protein
VITYAEVLAKIISTLTGRPVGAEIQPQDHEDTEIMILDYIEQLKVSSSGSSLREAHASATAGANCNLIWNSAFSDSFYTPVINGFDASGNPVEISLISKSTTKLVVRTLVDASLSALALPFDNSQL